MDMVEDSENGVQLKALGDKHMEHLKKFIDDNSSALLDQVMNSLTQHFQDLKIEKIAVYNFMTKVCSITFKKAHFHPWARNNEVTINKRHDWVIKWTNSDMDYLLNCVFIEEAGFHINLRRSMGWSEKGHAPIVQWLHQGQRHIRYCVLSVLLEWSKLVIGNQTTKETQTWK